MKVRVENGDEMDAFYAREYYNFKAGTIKKLKRQYHKRLRRQPIVNWDEINTMAEWIGEERHYNQQDQLNEQELL